MAKNPAPPSRQSLGLPKTNAGERAIRNEDKVKALIRPTPTDEIIYNKPEPGPSRRPIAKQKLKWAGGDEGRIENLRWCDAIKSGQNLIPASEKLRCRMSSGWGTNHPGYGRCRYHGGNTPTGITASEREMIAARMGIDSKTYGSSRNIGPHEALLEEVQRTAGHVEWLRTRVQALEEGDLVNVDPVTGRPTKVTEWVRMYMDERRHLVMVCGTAIKAGIAERQVQLAEAQGKIIAGLFVRFINDEAIALTPRQRLAAPKVVRNLLLELPAGDGNNEDNGMRNFIQQTSPHKVVTSEEVNVEWEKPVDVTVTDDS